MTKQTQPTLDQIKEFWWIFIYQARGTMNNEQLFNALASKLDGIVDFPMDKRTKEYKEKKRITNETIQALLKFAKILH